MEHKPLDKQLIAERFCLAIQKLEAEFTKVEGLDPLTNVTDGQLGRLIGVDKSTFSHLKKGIRIPTLDQYNQLIQTLNHYGVYEFDYNNLIGHKSKSDQDNYDTLKDVKEVLQGMVEKLGNRGI